MINLDIRIEELYPKVSQVGGWLIVSHNIAFIPSAVSFQM